MIFCGLYLPGTQVTLNAVDLAPGYEVAQWQNTPCNAGPSCTISVDTWPSVVLSLVQTQGIGEVPVSGGTVEFDNVASATFVADSFKVNQPVVVANSDDSDLWQDFDITKQMFKASYAAEKFVTINTGNVLGDKDVSLSINLPQSYLDNQPANTRLQVFVALLQQSSAVTIDSFELLSSQVQSATNTILTTIPKQAFTNRRTIDNSYEAVLMVAAIPDNQTTVKQFARGVKAADQQLLANHKATGAELKVTDIYGNKVKGSQDGTITDADHPNQIKQWLTQSPLNPLAPPNMQARVPAALNRSSKLASATAGAEQCPVSIASPAPDHSGKTQDFTEFAFHGVNYLTYAGSEVPAVRSGTVIKTGHDQRFLTDGTAKGWGRYVVLEDQNGHLFLYSHLASGHIGENAAITKGETIGSTYAEFVHFEFAPQQSAKINPDACIEQDSSGLSCTIVDINANYLGAINNPDELLCVAIYPEVATKFTGFITNYAPATADFDLALYLYNPTDGGVLALAQSSTTGTFDLIAGVINPSWYLMVVNGKNGATGNFTIGSQGITEFDEHEYNDTAATATEVSGVQKISGEFDSNGDLDWFKYTFTDTMTTARLFNHNDNAKMSVLTNVVTPIPAGTAVNVSGIAGQSFYFAFEPIAAAAKDDNQNRMAEPPWEASITGVEHHLSKVNWGSSETFIPRVNYWPHVFNYYQMSGWIYDASGAVVPNGQVGLRDDGYLPYDFAFTADVNGRFVHRNEFSSCQSRFEANVTTTDNYGRYYWRINYDVHSTNWWAVSRPSHILYYIQLCSSRVTGSDPW